MNSSSHKHSENSAGTSRVWAGGISGQDLR
jgi:hypothetical protein